MKNIRKLGAVVVLTFVLGVSAFAGCEPGQIMTPCDPGQTMTHGDMDAPTVTSTDPGQLETPPAPESQTSLTEIAADVLIRILLLF
jgi:hypothetical protein